MSRRMLSEVVRHFLDERIGTPPVTQRPWGVLAFTNRCTPRWCLYGRVEFLAPNDIAMSMLMCRSMLVGDLVVSSVLPVPVVVDMWWFCAALLSVGCPICLPCVESSAALCCFRIVCEARAMIKFRGVVDLRGPQPRARTPTVSFIWFSMFRSWPALRRTQ